MLDHQEQRFLHSVDLQGKTFFGRKPRADAVCMGGLRESGFESLEPRLLFSASLIQSVTDVNGSFRYLAGDDLPEVVTTFQAETTGETSSVLFELGSQSILDTSASDGWSADFNMSELAVGANLTVTSNGPEGGDQSIYTPDLLDVPDWMYSQDANWDASHDWSNGYSFDIDLFHLSEYVDTPNDWVVTVPGTSIPIVDMTGLATGFGVWSSFTLISDPIGSVSATDYSANAEALLFDQLLWEESLAYGTGDSIEFEYKLGPVDASLTLSYGVELVPTFDTNLLWQGVGGAITLSADLEASLPIFTAKIPLAQVPGILDLDLSADATASVAWGLSLTPAINTEGEFYIDYLATDPTITLGITGQGELEAGLGAGRAGVNLTGTGSIGLDIVYDPDLHNEIQVTAPASLGLEATAYYDTLWGLGPSDSASLFTWSYVIDDLLTSASSEVTYSEAIPPAPASSLTNGRYFTDPETNEFVFSVDYLSPGGTAPSTIRLLTDSTSHEMGLVSSDGLVWTYQIQQPNDLRPRDTYWFGGQDATGAFYYSENAVFQGDPDTNTDISINAQGPWSTQNGEQFQVSGNALVGGKAYGGLRVTVRANGSQIGEGTTDNEGNFTINALAPKSPGLYEAIVAVEYNGIVGKASSDLLVSIPADGYDFAINNAQVDSRISPGSTTNFSVAIQNAGTQMNSGDLVARLYAPTGEAVDSDSVHIQDLPAGITQGYVMALSAPEEEGIYTIDISIEGDVGDENPSDNVIQRAIRVGQRVPVDSYAIESFVELVNGANDFSTEFDIGDYRIRLHGGNVSGANSSAYVDVSLLANPEEDPIVLRTNVRLRQDSFVALDGDRLALSFGGWFDDGNGGWYGEVLAGVDGLGSSVNVTPASQSAFQSEMVEYVFSGNADLQRAVARTSYRQGSTIVAHESFVVNGNDLIYRVDTTSLAPGNYEWFVFVDATSGDDYFQRLELVVEQHDIRISAMPDIGPTPAGDLVRVQVPLAAASQTPESVRLRGILSLGDGTEIELPSELFTVAGTSPAEYTIDTLGLAPGTYAVTLSAELDNDNDSANNNVSFDLEVVAERPTSLAAGMDQAGILAGSQVLIWAEYTHAASPVNGAVVQATLLSPTSIPSAVGLQWSEANQRYESLIRITEHGSWSASVEAAARGHGPQSQPLPDLTVTNEAPSVVLTSLRPYEGQVVSPDLVAFRWAPDDAATPVAEVQTRYRLDGGAWSAWGSDRSVIYNGLSSGIHTFEVEAFDGDLVSDAVASRIFQVAPVEIRADGRIVVDGQGNLGGGDPINWPIETGQGDPALVSLWIRNESANQLSVSSLSLPAPFYLHTESAASILPGESSEIMIGIDDALSGDYAGDAVLTLTFGAEVAVYTLSFAGRVDLSPTFVGTGQIDVSSGIPASISPQVLDASDDYTDRAELQYELLDALTKGYLTLDNVTLSRGDTFTQADIDRGAVVYESPSGVSYDETLRLGLTDENGTLAPELNLLVTATVPPNQILPSKPRLTERFGENVVIDGDWMVASDISNEGYGGAEVYRRIDGEWVFQQVLGDGDPNVFSDEFDALDTTRWDVYSGSWTIDSGVLIGDPGNTTINSDPEQAQIHLTEIDAAGDYRFKVEGRGDNERTFIELYSDYRDSYQVILYNQTTELRIGRRVNGSYTQLESIVLETGGYAGLVQPGQTTELEVVKIGAEIDVYVNDTLISSFTDTVFGGVLTPGMRAGYSDDDTGSLVNAYERATWYQLQPAYNNMRVTSSAINGDLIVLGHDNASDVGEDAGIVTLFRRSGDMWEYEVSLPGESVNANFGTSVAISPDGARIIVGADGSFGVQEKAHVYRHESGQWISEATFTINDDYAEYGEAVALTDDYAFVGARLFEDGVNEHGHALSPGAVFVYQRSETSWSFVDRLIGSTTVDADDFGSSITVDGDYLAIGANDSNLGGGSAGAAYIFKLMNGVWTETSSLVSPAKPFAYEFGDSLEFININGKKYLAAGAPHTPAIQGANGEILANGNVFIYREDSSGEWVLVNRLISWGYRLGTSIAATDTQLVVGAPETRLDGKNLGSLFTFDFSEIADTLSYTGDIGLQVTDAAPYVFTENDFGVLFNGTTPPADSTDIELALESMPSNGSIYLNGRLSLPGDKIAYSDLVAGGLTFEAGSSEPGDDSFRFSFRSVSQGISSVVGSVLLRVNPLTDELAPWDTTSPVRSISSDNEWMVIGVPDAAGNASGSGAAYVFSRNESGYVQFAKLVAPDGLPGDQFGIEVSISGNRIIVAAEDVNTGIDDAGNAYVFAFNGSEWLHEGTLTPPASVTPESLFADDVAIDGDWAFVSAYRDDVFSDDEGAVYFYHWDGTEWAYVNRRVGSNVNDFYGRNLVADDGFLFIEVDGSDLRGDRSGHVEVFAQNGSGDWSKTQALVSSDIRANDEFGSRLAVEGRIAAFTSVYNQDSTRTDGGRVYIFEHNGIWEEKAILTLPGGGVRGDAFGFALAIAGGSVFVSAQNAGDNGEVYVYRNDLSGNWGLVEVLNSPDGITPAMLAGDEAGGVVATYNGSRVGQLLTETRIYSLFDSLPGSFTLEQAAPAFEFDLRNGLPLGDLVYAITSQTPELGAMIVDGGLLRIDPDPAWFGIDTVDIEEDNNGVITTRSVQVVVKTSYSEPNLSITGLLVPGDANPWLAGMPDGTVDFPEYLADTAPDYAGIHSPVLASPLSVQDGAIIEFSATGSTGNGDGPDGNPYITSHGTEPQYGIATAYIPVRSLIGVFLEPGSPDNFTAPLALDFSDPSSRDYLTLSPELRQPFFIGDGLTSGGVQQQIITPEGATRLYLGNMDGSDWQDNGGHFVVDLLIVGDQFDINGGNEFLETASLLESGQAVIDLYASDSDYYHISSLIPNSLLTVTAQGVRRADGYDFYHELIDNSGAVIATSDLGTTKYIVPEGVTDLFIYVPGQAPYTFELNVTTQLPLLGDTNYDGVVDQQDLVLVTTLWGQLTPDDYRAGADVNKDGSIGISDLDIVLARYGTSLIDLENSGYHQQNLANPQPKSEDSILAESSYLNYAAWHLYSTQQESQYRPLKIFTFSIFSLEDENSVESNYATLYDRILAYGSI